MGKRSIYNKRLIIIFFLNKIYFYRNIFLLDKSMELIGGLIFMTDRDRSKIN